MTGDPWHLTRAEVLFHRIADVIVLFAFLFMLRLTAWLIWPGVGFQVVEVRGLPATAQTGSLIHYWIDACQAGGAGRQVLIMRELEDHTTPIQLPGLVHTTAGDCESIERAVGIPSYTPAGVYRLRITTDLQANPLRHVRQVWHSKPFTIQGAAK